MITKRYAEMADTSRFRIFYDNAEIPSNAEPLGVVALRDKGNDINCGRERVFALAQEEAVKAGGNALYVYQYDKSGIWSSCHQITATILRISPETTPGQDPFAALHRPTGDTTYSAQAAQSLTLQPQYVTPQVQFGPPPVKKRSEWIAEFETGPAWRAAELIEQPDAETQAYSRRLMSGYSLGGRLGYFQNYWGISMVCSNYLAGTSGYATLYGNRLWLKTRDRITFVGPEVIFYSYSPSEKWRFHCSVGLGYIGYVSKRTNSAGIQEKHSGNTFGTNFALGADYKFDRSWSVGAKLHMDEGALGSITVTDANGNSQTTTLPDKQKESLNNLGLHIGLKYHFGSKEK
jgi:hypothetical protein